MGDERYGETASKPSYDDKRYDNTGILFKNHDKAGERERDYKGEATYLADTFSAADNT